MTLEFKDKVVVVTGSGGALGKMYALFYGSRGAKVVVNDLGSTSVGQGKNTSAADQIVKQIKAKGGIAVANYDSVENGDKIIQTALDNFGKVDILINNAGILRDISFSKMTDKDWDLIMKVHMFGAYKCTKAAWDVMKKQKFGRIINTSSSAGLYGSFGQVNYSSAKLGLHGFTLALAKEGAKYNIFTNTIAPLAASRMLETVLPKDYLDKFMPENIVPLVAYLTHESCQQNGSVFEVGGGFIAKLRWQNSQGVFFDPKTMSPEQVAKKWGQITDFSKKNEHRTRTDELFSKILEYREQQQENKVKAKL